MLIMLPISTVDNIDLKIIMLENRIGILKNMFDESTIEIKQKGISFLEEARDNLYRIKENIDK